MSTIKQALTSYPGGLLVEPAPGIEVCYEYNDPADKRKKLVNDPRSFQDSKGYWHVLPFAFTKSSVKIVCPHCGHIHNHGKAPGHRVSHCNGNNNTGYFIEEWEENPDEKSHE